MLVDGQWTQDWQPVQDSDGKGRFVRQQSSFRDVISRDADSAYPAQTGRYHLYVAAICPWANRVLIARTLKDLEDVVTVTVVEPFLTDQGWGFGDYPGSNQDEINGAKYLHQIYTRAAPHYTGRATVPVLWDKQTGTIVNNESADIVRIFNQSFGQLANTDVDLYPLKHQIEIDKINDQLYNNFCNGVYRAGFATTQTAYEEAVIGVFESLDWLDKRLAKKPYLIGEHITEADIRVFVTMIRFEPAYYGLFKCNRKHLWQYEYVWAYLQRLYALPAFYRNVNFDHIKQGYYSIKALNPTGIVPIGSDTELMTHVVKRVAQ